MPRVRPIRRQCALFLTLVSAGITCFFLGDHFQTRPTSLDGLLHLQGEWTVSATSERSSAAASDPSSGCLVFVPDDHRFGEDARTLFVTHTALHVESTKGYASAIVLHGYTAWYSSWIDSEVRRAIIEQTRCVCPCVPNFSTNDMLGGSWSKVVRPLVWPRVGHGLMQLSVILGAAALVPLTIVLARLGDDAPWSARRRCPHCNYDYSGLPPDRPCPECGTVRSAR